MGAKQSSQATTRLLGVMFAYSVLLSCLALWLPDQHFAVVFSETGVFERLGIVLWWVLAAWCIDPTRPPHRHLAMCGLICAIAAAREADWHKAFTQDSIFKSRYYISAPAPFVEKVVAATVALSIFAILIHALVLGARLVWSDRRHLLGEAWVQTLILGSAMLPVLYVLDRIRSWLTEDFGVQVTPMWSHLNSAWEEGFETLLPLIFAIALVQYRRRTEMTVGTSAAVGAGAGQTSGVCQTGRS